MGIFDNIFSNKKKKAPPPDFSNVRSGSSSTAPPPGPAASTAPPASSIPAGQAQRTYVVVSGDSLSKIAKREYGDANKWPKIFEANKSTIKDPNLIHPGQVLTIPPA